MRSLAGADVAMMTSALLRHGPDHRRRVEVELRDWMDDRSVETLDQLRGRHPRLLDRGPPALHRDLP
jgi:dihydroorotate dehydrogenase (fumarate)